MRLPYIELVLLHSLIFFNWSKTFTVISPKKKKEDVRLSKDEKQGMVQEILAHLSQKLITV